MRLIDADALKKMVAKYEFETPDPKRKWGGDVVLNKYIPQIIDDAPTVESADTAKHENECRQIAHYSDELKQCKRLLRKALRTLDKKTNSCIDCAKAKSAPCEICEWLWNRREEALKLLGEDELI